MVQHSLDEVFADIKYHRFKGHNAIENALQWVQQQIVRLSLTDRLQQGQVLLPNSGLQGVKQAQYCICSSYWSKALSQTLSHDISGAMVDRCFRNCTGADAIVPGSTVCPRLFLIYVLP